MSLLPYSSSEKWDFINASVRKKHFAAEAATGVTVRVFKGLAQALVEIAVGSQQFLSHKKNIGIFNGATSTFEMLPTFFIRDGLVVRAESQEKFPKTLQEAQEFVQSLPKDMNYVLFCEDHLVTGETYNWDFLDQVLNEKRIISIRVSHASHYFLKPALRPFSVRLCVYSESLVVALCGSRFKTPPVYAPWMSWRETEVEDLSIISFADQSLVENFESEFPQQKFLQTNSRLFDRAVLCFHDMNADTFLDVISQGQATAVCHLGHFRSMISWWRPLLTAEEIRGLLLIPAALLKEKNLAKSLRSAYEDRKRQQSWVIK